MTHAGELTSLAAVFRPKRHTFARRTRIHFRCRAVVPSFNLLLHRPTRSRTAAAVRERQGRKEATMLYLTLEDNPFPEQKYDENALLEVGRILQIHMIWMMQQ